MLHIVKQFMTGLTVMLKCEFAEAPSGSAEPVLETNQTEKLSSAVKGTPEAAEITSDTKSELNDLYNEVKIDNLGYIKDYISAMSVSTLKKGAASADVGKLQYALLLLDYNLGTCGDNGDGVDRNYGDKAYEAVSDLQAKIGVTVTGEFDKGTKDKLLAVVNAEISEREEASKPKEDPTAIIAESSAVVIGDSNTDELDINVDAQEQDIQVDTSEKQLAPDVSTEKLTDDNVNKDLEIQDDETKDITTQEIIAEKNGINYESLLKIISGMTFDQLKDLQLFFVENNRKSEWSKMRKLNYVPDGIFGMFGNFEMNKIIRLVDSVIDNQEYFNNNSNFRDKLKIIFDYNADGLLDSNANFYTEEKEMFEAVENETQFENILKNLGYTDKTQFDAEFSDNYLTAREKFKTQLARSLGGDYVIDPIYMMSDPKAKAKLNEKLQTISDEVEGALSLNEKVISLSDTYPEIAKLFKEKALEKSRQVYLQSVAGVVGLARGAAASFDVSEFTNSIVDTVGIGMVNGVFGIQIGKELYQSESGNTRVSAGLVNFYPYIGASHEIFEEDISELQNLFEPIVDNGMKLTLGGAVNFKGVVGGIDYTKVDETTQEGIEQMKAQMSGLLETVFDNIEKGNGFSESGLPDNIQNAQAYLQIEALYRACGENDVAKQDIISGALNNYERELFRNASGLNITGVSFGVTNITQYLPILGIHGEYKNQDWEERRFVITDPELSQEVPGRNFSTIQEMETLNKELTEYESGFSWKTRWNTGAKAFLSPTNSISDRWAGLLKLSTVPKALREVQLHAFLETKKDASDAEKLVIISTLAGWTRKSSDVKEAKTPSDLITLDKKRRSGFNENFGFNTDKYAEAYYTQLAKTTKMTQVIQQGTAFDAVSTLHVEKKGSVKGVDILHANLSMVADENGKAIQVEITDADDIEAFAKNIEGLSSVHGTGLSTLAQGIRDGDYKLMFFKDPDGFDDRIVPVFTQTRKVIVYNPVNEVTNWALFGIEDGGSDKKTRGDNTETTPTTGNADDIVDPGNTATGSGGFGNNGEIIVPEVRIDTASNGIPEASATLLYGAESRNK